MIFKKQENKSKQLFNLLYVNVIMEGLPHSGEEVTAEFLHSD